MAAVSHSMVGKSAKVHRKHKITSTRVSPRVESTRGTVFSVSHKCQSQGPPGAGELLGWGTTVLKARDSEAWALNDKQVSNLNNCVSLVEGENTDVKNAAGLSGDY